VTSLAGAPAGQVTIYWEGRPIAAREGDSVAAALHAAGIRVIGRSRKLHRPMGAGGGFVLGLQAEVDGIANQRLDRIRVRAGLSVRAQNVWPNQRFDLLRLARVIPRHWLRGGFEHPRWLPSGTARFDLWEQALRFLAGGGRAPAPDAAGAVLLGEKIAVDVAVVGGGPVGRAAAIESVAAGRTTLLISRGLPPGRFAEAMGSALPTLPEALRVLAGWEAAALYRRGGLLLAAPHDGGPALAIEARRIVLATGRRSCPPLVPGADLPGVMDLRTAVDLLHFSGVAPGRIACLIGTGDLDAVAQRLRELRQTVAAVVPAASVRRILGNLAVTGVALADGRRIACDSVIHAGPWRPDPMLGFQASADGALRLEKGAPPAHIEVAGSAGQPGEPVLPAEIDDAAFVCPCMDVSVAEIRDLARAGGSGAKRSDTEETHVEVLKRLTGCGMGPCQGQPCWDYLAAVLARITGRPAETFGHPSYRPPRGTVTLGQAAGLADIVAPAPPP
jgi:sarcosine oxidase subunit alpha